MRARQPSAGLGRDTVRLLAPRVSFEDVKSRNGRHMGTEVITHRSTGVWVETPLIYSSYISDRLGCSVHLKLENLQPSQSFKYRGISLRLQQAKAQYGSALHVFITSSGNAGLAAAIAARMLEIRCTVYLPVVVTKDTRDILRSQGASVVLVGQIYSDALVALYQAAEGDPNALVLASYDDPVLWKGHSSMVEEMKYQSRRPPDAIFCVSSVAYCLDANRSIGTTIRLQAKSSIVRDLSSIVHLKSAVPSGEYTPEAPYTVQTSEEHQVAVPHMHTLTSRAVSLGATWPAPGVVRMVLDHVGGVRCVCIPDELAMFTGRGFADDHKFLIELACSTAMSPAYNHKLFWRILDPMLELSAEERRKKSVIFVVCGGVKVTVDELSEYAQVLDQVAETAWKVMYNGTELCVGK